MSAPTTLRVTTPYARRRAQPEQVLDITATPDDRLLLSIPDALKAAGSVANRPPPSTLSSPAITSIFTDRLWGSVPTTTRCDSIVGTNGLSSWQGTATSS